MKTLSLTVTDDDPGHITHKRVVLTSAVARLELQISTSEDVAFFTLGRVVEFSYSEV